MSSAARSSPAICPIVLRTSTATTNCSPRPPASQEPSLCPVGIRIFADALANVAHWNGMESSRHSWRHGSIASRIAFLERLEQNPDQELRFQRGVRRLRVALGIVLALAILIAAFRQFSQ